MQKEPKFQNMWLMQGKLFCSEKCAGGGVSFAFAAQGTKCGTRLLDVKVPKRSPQLRVY